MRRLDGMDLRSIYRMDRSFALLSIAGAGPAGFGLLEELVALLDFVVGRGGGGEGLVGLLLFELFVVSALAELVDTGVVDLVRPGLVQVDEEDDVVSESGQAVQDGHLDGEGEEVVDESVEELVRHCSAGHMGDGLEAVVDVESGDLT